MRIFFTADEHYGHRNIIGYCDRPFAEVDEMDAAMIGNHNEVVGDGDVVVHAGDFTLCGKAKAEGYIKHLNGTHIFLQGSHDRFLKKSSPYIWRKRIEDQLVVVCHYAMRTWEESHYGSWQLYGHSHGNLDDIGLQMDIGVDCHHFRPISFDEVRGTLEAMHGKIGK